MIPAFQVLIGVSIGLGIVAVVLLTIKTITTSTDAYDAAKYGLGYNNPNRWPFNRLYDAVYRRHDKKSEHKSVTAKRQRLRANKERYEARRAKSSPNAETELKGNIPY